MPENWTVEFNWNQPNWRGSERHSKEASQTRAIPHTTHGAARCVHHRRVQGEQLVRKRETHQHLHDSHL